MTEQHVCILMATYNGSSYLTEQLTSFIAQDHTSWSLNVRDDGSTDSSVETVLDFSRAHPERDVSISAGSRTGTAATCFLTLLSQGDWPSGACVALSDQDDIWMPDRLSRALSLLPASGAPAIYASRTILTDAQGRPRRVSVRHPKPPAFANALVQNILPGNTIVLNPAAAALAQSTATAALHHCVPHHDWWLYLVMSGAGVEICTDDRPGLYYRQHSNNLLGANRGWRKAANRFLTVWDRTYAGWIDCNLSALQMVAPKLKPENRELVSRFADWRCGETGRGPLSQIGVWRQTKAGSLLLSIAARLGRL